MRAVDPIKNKKKLENMKNYLKGYNMMYYFMFVTGINTCLRISDILKLTWKDILEADKKTMKVFLVLKEKKTNKTKKIELNKSIEKAMKDYINSLRIDLTKEDFNRRMDNDSYVFESRQRDSELNRRAITRDTALKLIKKAAKAVGIKDDIGTHSMRKTWGWWALQMGVPPAYLVEAYNHSSFEITKRYLGITQDEINQIYRKVLL